jgi:hypothetical protein
MAILARSWAAAIKWNGIMNFNDHRVGRFSRGRQVYSGTLCPIEMKETEPELRCLPREQEISKFCIGMDSCK